ncbi:hypothetical protein MMC25_001431 [Agyrium rufum]|nr:hypothetical protein [Agyrium rufum]
MELKDKEPADLISVEDISAATRLASTTSLILDQPPSCIEFAPLHPNTFVVGTYSLAESIDESTRSPKSEEEADSSIVQSRSGSLILFQIVNLKLRTIQTLQTQSGAVLDLLFNAFLSTSNTEESKETFLVATSKGAVEICTLTSSHTSQESRIDRIRIIQVCSPNVLVLSLACHPSQNYASTCAVSLSDGSIRLLETQTHHNPHSLEVWTVAWSSNVNEEGEATLYSGGDDAKLCTVSLALEDDAQRATPLQPEVSQKKGDPVRAVDTSTDEDKSLDEVASSGMVLVGFDGKSHEAGVTAILSLDVRRSENTDAGILLTGSYDEFVRVLLPLGNGKRRVAAEKRLDGGVWRLKPMWTLPDNSKSHNRSVILASCMHAGTRILEVFQSLNGDWEINVFACLEENESMNYGSDWTKHARPGSSQSTVLIASISFYDRKLCLTKLPRLI